MKVSMQHEYSKVDVLIVGAGPVGMVLACELLRHGLSVKVIDKSPTTKQYSRAPVFWPRAQEALQLMQLHHLWEGTYTTLRRMNVNVYGKPAGIVHLDACESSKPVSHHGWTRCDRTDPGPASWVDRSSGCTICRSREHRDACERREGLASPYRWQSADGQGGLGHWM